MRDSVRHTRILVSCLALSTTTFVCETAFAERFVEYLHVEASSGASGGGHAAMRIGDTTYHYVYAEPGLIESTAEPNEDFDYAYRALGNRDIHVSRIVTDDASYAALVDAFERRHITQRAQLARLETAERDTAWVAYLRARRCAAGASVAGDHDPRIRGAGYFDLRGTTTRAGPTLAASGDPPPRLDTSVLAELKAEVERAYGRTYLATRARVVERELRDLVYLPPSHGGIAEGTIPPYGESFAVRAEALLAASIALDVLSRGRLPVSDAFRSLDSPTDRLDDEQLRVLAARAKGLRASLVRLVASRRQDWGYPMLVGMARLVAFDASLRSGHLVVPDSFDTAASSVPVERLLADTGVVDALLDERRAELATAREEMFAAPPGNESTWSRLEVAASAMLELRNAVSRRGGPVRRYPETMLPSRSSEIDPTAPLPAAACDTLARWAVAADDAMESLRDRLRVVYHYDVISRNCVTEIFRTVETAGLRLGTGDAPAAGLGFVPFVSAAAVNERFPVQERSTLPSYRGYWLARLRDTEGRFRTAARESNTLTATLRHPDDRDDVFLFYTDDVTALRPIYGAMNVGVGAGASLVGLATLPFDHGRLLTTAVRSVVFSVPELAFVNFRKGRNGFLPRDWMQAWAGDDVTTGTVRPANPF